MHRPASWPLVVGMVGIVGIVAVAPRHGAAPSVTGDACETHSH